MVSVVLTLKDKKLGFTLNKNSKTPTIDKITSGGCLENEMIETCTNISSGCQIKYIGTHNVENYSYDKVFNYIKSCNERPLSITFCINKQNNNKKNITESEMNKQSEQLTKQCLRDLVKSQKNKKRFRIQDISSDEDDVSIDNFHDKNSKESKLEEKNRMLMFEIENLKIDNKDREERLFRSINPILNINDDFCGLKNVIIRFNSTIKNARNDTSTQLCAKLIKLNKEYSEHKTKLVSINNKNDFNEIKECIELKIKKIDCDKSKLELNLEFKIKIKYGYEKLMEILFVLFIMCIIRLFIVYF